METLMYFNVYLLLFQRPEARRKRQEEEDQRRQENEDAFKKWLELKNKQKELDAKKFEDEKRNSSQDTTVKRISYILPLQ